MGSLAEIAATIPPEGHGWIFDPEQGRYYRNIGTQDSQQMEYQYPQPNPAWQQQQQALVAQTFAADPQFEKLTPERAQAIASGTAGPQVKGLYNDSMYGGTDFWQGPEGKVTSQSEMQAFEEAMRDMRYGATIPALAFLAAGGAALAGGSAAGGAGVAGGAEVAGSGAVAGGSAASGAGATLPSLSTGASLLSGGSAAANLLGDAGGDTLSSMPPAQFDDPLGGYNVDPNTGDVFSGTGDNPFGQNFSGGDSNSFFSGFENDPTALQQIQDLAKQFGLTPANATKLFQSAGGAGGILSALGRGAPGVIGAFGANQQANSLSALADKYMALGAPSRARYESSFAPGFSMANEPGYADALDQTTKSFLHKASIGGNPSASPNAWEATLKDVNSTFAFPALQNYRNMNANAGGISSLQTAAPAAATGAIGAQGNIFNALGSSASSIFNPPKTLAEQLAELRKQGLY